MTIDITYIVACVVIILITAFAAFVYPKISKNINAETLKKIIEWIDMLVQSAEEQFKGSGRGEEKLSYVLKRLQELGVKLDVVLLKDLITSAVYRLINKEKKN